MDDMDRDFGAEFAQLREQQQKGYAQCLHGSTEIRRKTFANGTHHFAPQCLTCGQRTGDWISKLRFNGGAVKDWDEHLTESYHAKRREAYDADGSSYNYHWWNLYNDYLFSKQWEAKRGLVLKRVNNICEGCGVRVATQVHHCTYAHVGNELLFELVAICSICHDRIHGTPEQERDEELYERAAE